MTITGNSAVVRNAGLGAPTTGLEKSLIALTIVALPTENHFLFIPGFSLQFILFGIIAVYIVLNRFFELLNTVVHPALLSAYLFLTIGFLLEWTHDDASYYELIRVAQMIGGAILIACLCRDLPALRMACYGYLTAGLYLSILLFFTAYGALSASTASDFQEASKLRAEVFEDNPLQANLNNMAFGAAQAAVVALSWGLLARRTLPRGFYAAAGLICLIGTFLSLSRSGVAIVLASCTGVMYAFGLRHAKEFLIAALLAGVVLMLVPQSVWSRMSFTFEKHEGKTEGRALVYGTAIDHLPEYFMTGVGAGNFWTSWGRRTEFASVSGRVSGAHNSLMQVTLYWGILGLMGFLLVFWQAYRCVPRCAGREAAALTLIGIGISALLLSMVTHNIYAKEFTLALGLLVGSHRWIWPQGFVYSPSGLKTQRPL
jgi:hypothetical protein